MMVVGYVALAGIGFLAGMIISRINIGFYQIISIAALLALIQCAGKAVETFLADEPTDKIIIVPYLADYSDEFNGTSLDAGKWHVQTAGWMDAQPPAATVYTISYSVAGGELLITPETALTADWWNHWHGPGIFSNYTLTDWSATDYQVDLSVSFTSIGTSASHFAGLIIQDAADEFHYIKFMIYGSSPALFDMNIIRHCNPWETNATTPTWSRYFEPTTDLTFALPDGVTTCLAGCWSGKTGKRYDSWYRPNDTVVDYPDFNVNTFAAWVSHTRTSDSAVLRISKLGNVVTFYYSQDGGTTFTKGMSGYFYPAQVKIGMVANEMGDAFGGDAQAHFQYIRVSK